MVQQNELRQLRLLIRVRSCTVGHGGEVDLAFIYERISELTKRTANKGKNDAKGTKQANGGYDRNVRWVNPQLNSDDIDKLEGALDSGLEGVFEMCDRLQTTQSLSVKLDERSGRWNAILFDRSGSENSPVHALSLRAATPFDALIALAYVVIYKLPDDWQEAASESLGRFN